MFYNLKTNLNQKVEFLWHKETSLKKCDFIILQEDFHMAFLRSGAIAQFSPIMKSVIEHANNGGFVMGICNSFKFFAKPICFQEHYLEIIIKNLFAKPILNLVIRVY